MKESDAHPHVDSERADLFRSYDGGSTEVEYLELLTALVRVEKPEMILETGTYRGFGTIAILRGCVSNGLGKIVSLDLDQNKYSMTRVKDYIIQYVETDSIEWISNTDLEFDMAFFDSELSIRCKECKLAMDKSVLKRGGLAVFHDTSVTRIDGTGNRDPKSAIFWNDFNELIKERYFSSALTFPLSRGMVIARVL